MQKSKRNPAQRASAGGAGETVTSQVTPTLANNAEAVNRGIFETALSFARRGMAVFPAKFVGKQKLGHTSADKSNGNPWGYTTDAKEIADYWRRWPGAAIGLPTGSVNRLFVLDIDVKAGGHEHDGVASIRELIRQHGELPPTVSAITPTGGIHRYFVQPAGAAIPCSASKLGPGIDVRGEGGFVIAPPSVRPRVGTYIWDTTGPRNISPAPQWLLDLLIKRPRVLETADLDPEMLAAMLQDIGDGVSLRPEDNAPVYAPMSPDDLELEIRVALSVIPSDEYDIWYRIGAAIYQGLGDAGFSLFDEWSRESHKYDPRACQRKWQDCSKVNSIRVETIFWHATNFDPGWRALYRRLLNGEVSV